MVSDSLQVNMVLRSHSVSVTNYIILITDTRSSSAQLLNNLLNTYMPLSVSSPVVSHHVDIINIP